jgi:hypothetical protein
MSKKNYFNNKPSSWQDNFEDMRVQSEMIRKATGMSEEVAITTESRSERDYREMMESFTDEDYQEAMRQAAQRFGQAKTNETPVKLRSSSKVKQLSVIPVKHNPAATASRIAAILKEFGEGLHITRVIEELANRAQLSQSVHHRYSHISKVLNSNYLLFEKIGPATFKARDVTLAIAKDNVPKKSTAKRKDTRSPSIKDLILWASKKYANKFGYSPRKITSALWLMGIDVSYDTVKKVMGDERREFLNEATND